MRYRFNKKIYNTPKELDAAIRQFAMENYDKWLNETCDEYRLFGIVYKPSDIASTLNYKEYTNAINDYAEELYSKIRIVK